MPFDEVNRLLGCPSGGDATRGGEGRDYPIDVHFLDLGAFVSIIAHSLTPAIPVVGDRRHAAIPIDVLAEVPRDVARCPKILWKDSFVEVEGGCREEVPGSVRIAFMRCHGEPGQKRYS